ncbi:hypothetical protein BKK53_04675 [Rodentibacter trehalosifermentans]|nr:hypothetical protein BKK53_04675 [Rodentibacter trehalosifermentans]
MRKVEQVYSLPFSTTNKKAPIENQSGLLKFICALFMCKNRTILEIINLKGTLFKYFFKKSAVVLN